MTKQDTYRVLGIMQEKLPCIETESRLGYHEESQLEERLVTYFISKLKIRGLPNEGGSRCSIWYVTMRSVCH